MALFSMFKTPKHQKFVYKPRYWNPQKEDLKARLKLAKDKDGADPEAMKARISQGFKRTYGKAGYGTERASAVKKSNYLLLAVIIILLFLCYLFLSVYLPGIAEAMEGKVPIEE